MLTIFSIFVLLILPAITTATLLEEIADALIDASDTEGLQHTFKTLQAQCNGLELPEALACVAARGDISTVIKCLRMTRDSFPDDKLCVNPLIHNTLYEISCITHDAGSFAKVITAFNPSDVKPLASLRVRTISRDDSVDVLKHLMIQHPKLIVDYLPSWLTSHVFNFRSFFTAAREETFQYLASLATRDVLEKALSIVKEEGHYKVELENGGIIFMCCWFQEALHRNLLNKLNGLLQLVEARKALVIDLAILPLVLSELVLEYTACDIPPDHFISRFGAVVQSQCCIIT